jgi:tyrosinase
MVRVRKDVWGLGGEWNDTLLWYAKGVRVLQSRPLTDRTSWRFLAAIHGMHPTVWRQFGIITATTPAPPAAVQRRFWNQCQHQSWYFLPWHRGYLAAFETIVRDAILADGGPDDWALPYWNYSDPVRANARRIPDAFELPALPDGSPNPLHVERRFGDGTSPIELDPSFVALTALQADVFPGGDGDIPPGLGGPETVFHHGPESDTTNGALEALPHNVIHSAIGGVTPGGNPNDWRDLGLMSMPITAALDPIFWLHHANIDLLWNAWLLDAEEQHANPVHPTWLEGPVDRRFVMPRSGQAEWTFTAQEVLDTAAPPLEYRYDDETAPPIERRAARRMGRLGAQADAAGRAGRSEDAMAEKRRTAEAIGASEGPVRITGSTGASIQLDASPTRALRDDLELAAAAPGSRREPARVFLKLEGIRGTSDAAIYHVYVGLPPNADPEAHRDRLAGTVSLFGVSAASDPDGPAAGSGINQVLEITEIVDALHLSGDDLNHLAVQFVPATASVAAADFSIGRLSVFKLGE